MTKEPDLRTDRKEARRQRLMQSRCYRLMTRLTLWMDRYYIDPILGLIPGGWGDLLSAVMLLPFLWFSIFVVRSLPLTLAIVYNTLKDMAMGLIPFYVGDILDAFSHSYARNMKLIRGFVDDDRETVREVNRKSWFFAAAIIVCLLAVVALIALSAYLLRLLAGAFQ